MTPSRFHWTNFLVVASSHLAAAFAVVYLVAIHFSWWTLGFGLLWGTLCTLSISGGYHRLFSHGTYEASALLRAFYLLFGAASVQNSALAWAADHRAHHANTDDDGDPYNIKRGFWWAHIGWVFRHTEGERDLTLVRNLEADPLVQLQHRFYVPIAVALSVVVPAAIGTAWGDPLGAFLVAGFLRLVLQWHTTFSINSLAHWVGRRPYSRVNSARDSFWLALFTMGEGYHNFHHRFQRDYRNGVRWYHFDPTKWWVWTMAQIGLARRLRRVPSERIRAVRRAMREVTTLRIAPSPARAGAGASDTSAPE